MKALRAILLIARREYLAYVMAWGFWLSLVSTPLLFIAMSAAPALLRKAEPTRVLIISSENAKAEAAIRASFDRRERENLRDAVWNFAYGVAPDKAEAVIAAYDAAPDREAALAAARGVLGEAGAKFRAPAPAYHFAPAPADMNNLAQYLLGQRQVEGAPVFAAFIVKGDDRRLALQYWSVNLTDSEPINRARGAITELMRREALAAQGLSLREVQSIDEMSPEFAQFDPRARAGAAVTARDRAPFLAAIALTFILWSSTIGVANMLLTGVIEEKSNKILDSLLTAVTPLQILCGKLLGVAAVSATLFAVWGMFASAALGYLSSGAVGGLVADAAGAALSPALGLTFLACFAAGYLLFGALFLGLGSLCDSLQEAQSLIGPIFLLMIVPLLLIGPAFANPKAPIIEAAAWIPLFAPFVLLLRAPAGLSFAEIAGPMLVLGVSIIVVLTFAGRVFEAGISQQFSFSDLKRKFSLR